MFIGEGLHVVFPRLSCRLRRNSHVHGREQRRRGIGVLVAISALVGSAAAGYTVQRGDTLSAIALRHGTSVSALVEANDIADPDLVYTGEQLVVPGSASGSEDVPPTAGTSMTQVVRPGETLGAIAARFGLSVEALARANGITDTSRVLAGSLLRITSEVPPPPGVGGRVGADGTTWACPWVSTSYVNDFGVSKPDGRYHEGIDVYAPGGSDIRAPVSGVVEQVTGSRAGMQFTLRGDDGYTYIGAHMATFGASGRVEAGEVIGTVGDSGNAKGAPPHTHIEMHNDGVVNPYPTLEQYCG